MHILRCRILALFYPPPPSEALRCIWPTPPLDITLQGPDRLFFCTHSTPFMFPGFLENWVFAILELSFSKNWRFLGKNYLILFFFKHFVVKLLRITLFLGSSELSFWAKTEFSVIFGIWVFENPELSFLVLYKKKACFKKNSSKSIKNSISVNRNWALLIGFHWFKSRQDCIME